MNCLEPQLLAQSISDDLLDGVARDYYAATEANLLDRWAPVGQWYHARGAVLRDPFQKVVKGNITPVTCGYLRDGTSFQGVNFASQDYLSLASDERVKKAIISAIEEYGVHSAGSSALMGNSVLSQELERRLEEFLGYRECTLFSTGWMAGFGIVRMLAGPGDHIVLDVLAHACLQEGAECSGAAVHRFPHLSNVAVDRRLKRIRSESKNAGILVITETLFSMDSDVPNISELQEICRRYNATLVVDCAHDLGCLGVTGRGILHEQEMVGKVDVLIGTFSKTFASIGGFVATQREGFRTVLRAACGAQTFTNAMTPVQAGAILKTLDIIDDAEGVERRKKLLANAVYLRNSLADVGFEVVGLPSAIVPVIIGDSAVARRITSFMLENGAIVNLVEAPAVARNKSRLRLQVMADHTRDHINQLIDVAKRARSAILK